MPSNLVEDLAVFFDSFSNDLFDQELSRLKIFLLFFLFFPRLLVFVRALLVSALFGAAIRR